MRSVYPVTRRCFTRQLLQARTDNLLLLGAINFQLRNFSEAIFYNQQVYLCIFRHCYGSAQAIRIEPQMAEAYSNLANALKELGDVRGAMQLVTVSCRIIHDLRWESIAA